VHLTQVEHVRYHSAMRISKETKFGYGFLLAGVGLPNLIEKLLGPLAALVAAAVCTVGGVGLLAAGHFHREKTIGFEVPQRNVLPAAITVTLLLGMIISLFVAVKRFRFQEERHITEKSEPVQPVQPESRPEQEKSKHNQTVSSPNPEVLLIFEQRRIEIHNPGPHTLYLYGGAYGDVKVKLEKDPPRVIVPGAFYYLFAGELEDGMRSHLQNDQTGRDTFHAFVKTEEGKRYTIRGLLIGAMKDGTLTVNTQVLPTVTGWRDKPI
jgi:hypothetical protein